SNTSLKICACLGKLSDTDAAALFDAGVQRYNHNVNTTAEHYANICTTHTHDDRIDTLQHVKQAGISPCSGAIFGMGETLADRVQIAFDVRALEIDSIPCNFLVSIEGTRLEGMDELSPQDCLRILAMMRFVNPSKEIRISGGREKHLRTLQPLGLMIADAIFIGDYLTTPGQAVEADHAMIRDLGYTVVSFDRSKTHSVC
ncbi:MAG: biotin synthase BioB, partial [Bacilli bacterium]